MIYRVLGRTGLRVSIAGLGTGGASRLGQSYNQTRAESERVVRVALDLGVNLFDTARAYRGSEELLGSALEGVPRDRYVLTTKFSITQGDQIHSDPEALTRQLEESLRLLRVDYVDVLQYHLVMPNVYDEVVERFHPAALRAQEAGKTRFIGITESVSADTRHEMLPKAIKSGLFDTIMVRYGILNQWAEREVLPAAQQANIGVLVMAAVRTSLRTPEEAVRHLEQFINEGLLDMPRPDLRDPLGFERAGEPVTELTRAAYQFAAAHPAVSSVLIGTGNVEHLKKNVQDLLSPRLTEGQMAYLRRTFGGLTWNA
ncbi:MAG: aldo/keto reductase [Chloroflexi bacterium]|jgi:L-galactose dehydrogenase|nr:aldo/keto reductase [Chloroflexota bacterium]